MKSEAVVKAVFKRRFEEIKDDIESGRITFYNRPEVWTEKMLKITALNCVLLLIAEEAKWN